MKTSGLSLVVLLCASVLLPGCASYEVVKTPSLATNASSQGPILNQGDLTLQAKAIHKKEELEAQFGGDLLKYGVLPVQVYVANTSDEGAIAVRRDDYALIMPSGEKAMRLNIDQVMDRAGKSFWRTAGWGVAFGIFGAIPSAMNVSNTNKEMRADFELRQINDKTLMPGENLEGILFFNVPKDFDTLNDWKLTLLTEASNGPLEPLEFPFSGTVALRKKTDDPE